MKYLQQFFVLLLIAPSVFAEQRLVTIDGSITEIVYALGEESQLVARDDTSIYPEAVHQLPSVGYMRALSTEGVLSVKPTKVLVTESAGPDIVLKQLSRSSVDVVTIKTAASLDGVREKIQKVGHELGDPQKIQALISSYDKQVSSLENLLSEKVHAFAGKKTLIFLGMQANQLNAAGKNTKAQAVMDILGLHNAVSHQAYKPLSREALLAVNPEVIIVAAHGKIDQNKLKMQFSFTDAFKHNRIIFVSSAELLSFGPRLPKVLLHIASSLANDEKDA